MAKLFDLTGDTNEDFEEVYQATDELIVWGDILRAAKSNPALQEALDRAKIIYTLSEPL